MHVPSAQTIRPKPARRNLLDNSLRSCLAGCLLLGSHAGAEILPGPAGAPAQTAACIGDLATRIKRPAADLRLAESMPRIWSDSSLGLPEPGMAYTQASVPGHALILTDGHSRYLYTCSADAFRFAGDEGLWKSSLLHLAGPVETANLNATLYQCSLIGTGRTRIAQDVTAFYPQADGWIAIVRRRSRSGMDLLKVRADGLGLAMPLASAQAMGAAAFDPAQDRWAAFTRPGLGQPWILQTGSLRGDAAASRSLALPEGWMPEALAWEHPKIRILGRHGNKPGTWIADLSATEPAWAAEPLRNFPTDSDMVLNKSQSLDIRDAEGGGAVELSTLWFHGQRDPIARLDGMSYTSAAMIDGAHVLVNGKGRNGAEACVVNLHSESVHPRIEGLHGEAKLFRWEPLHSPLKEGPAQFER